MKIEGQYILPGPPEAVWERLNDPAILVKSLPGVETLEPDGPDRYRAKIQYKMGAVSGTFAGEVELSDKNPPHAMKLKTSARGGPGFVTAVGQLDLVAKGKETEVHYSGDLQLGGLLAAVGSRMMEGAAKKSIDEFFQAIATSLGNSSQ
ncbi:MAG TPA: carbon monoxide dehydrogenase subunit G [Candidatus Dormibacteraeota bacterium]|nr:carbon monoxide dehydrogenase subunit G [Candidatus Dormibacteraeota bacterium]